MNFNLNHPVIIGLHQLDCISQFRDKKQEIRSIDVCQNWSNFQKATINGLLEDQHIYFIVSRKRVRFSGLKFPQNQHFFYHPETKKSPVAINFQELSGEQNVIDGTFDLSEISMRNTLLDSFKSELKIEQLSLILGEPKDQQFVTAASFIFQKNNSSIALNVVSSPDLWKYVIFPNHKPEKGLAKPTNFDYRIEYIGKTINHAEDRIGVHNHLINIQGHLSSQESNREVFAVMYQLDFTKNSGESGVGNRDNQLELEACEAMLIQHFKPKYNARSMNFTITNKNEDIFDENLAARMRASKNYSAKNTKISVVNPASIETTLNLSWGRFYTDHFSEPDAINNFVF